MKQVDLSALVDAAAAGEEIFIAENGEPRAKLVAIDAISASSPRKREFGFWAHYGWKLPENFDDPDPEIESMFYGDDAETDD